MLLQFVVGNYLSFRDDVMLNMIPANIRKHKNHLLIDDRGKKTGSLPIAAIYGANASGKSNLVKSINFAKKLIIRGTRGEQNIPIRPFLLSKENKTKPCKFEFVIKHEGVIYTYGFLVSSTMIEKEWLYAYYTNREVCLFERETKNNDVEISFGKQIIENSSGIKVLNLIKKTTRPNQLFLKEAYERNVEKIKPIMRWFRYHLEIILPDTKYDRLVLRAHTDKEFEKRLGDFLKIADTGIDGISTLKEKVSLDKHFPDIPAEIRELLLDDINKISRKNAIMLKNGEKFFAITKDEKLVGEPSLLSLKLRHQGSDGIMANFDTDMESDGTLRIMHLFPALLDLEKNEKVYIIDEIDRSMHPLLCKFFARTFLNSQNAKKSRGQLVVTTHQNCLLDKDLLRNDEIWFIEKDEEGGSKMTSLAEFKVRPDLRLDKGYLNGRFGAIPIFGESTN